jgi:hypothetical protein
MECLIAACTLRQGHRAVDGTQRTRPLQLAALVRNAHDLPSALPQTVITANLYDAHSRPEVNIVSCLPSTFPTSPARHVLGSQLLHSWTTIHRLVTSKQAGVPIHRFHNQLQPRSLPCARDDREQRV